MAQKAELANLKILVTRPESQAKDLARQIQVGGGIPLLLPCIMIAEADDITSLSGAAATLDRFDMAIFISPNAVEKSMAILKKTWPSLPKDLRIGCIGEGTAQSLANNQITVDFYPKTHFNSEELLALPELHNIAGKRIVLFKGEGGKPLLADTLELRGAIIYNAICYKRSCPKVNIEPLLNYWQNDGIDVVISTSQEALNNLIEITGKQGQRLLRKTPLLVISPTMAETAKQLQFKTIISANNATDQAIMTALIQYRKQLNG
jgi:uroporphyrinogen-III synthase